MNSCVARAWQQDFSTRSGAFSTERQSPSADVLFAWMVMGTSGWTAVDDERFDCLMLLGPGTTSRWWQVDEPPPSQSALAELRSKTQLTWAQLARALGVQRRSLHFWARGERPSAANFERLMRVIGIVRAAEAGDAAQTTSFLLGSTGSGPSPFTLLCEGRDDEVLKLLTTRQRQGDDAALRPRRPPQLSRESRERRRGGVSPLEKLDTLHDEPGVPTIGPLLGSVVIRAGRDMSG